MSKRPSSYKSRNIPRKHKTTTKEGKNEYMRQYMRIRRSELKQLNQQLPKMRVETMLGVDLEKLRRRQ